MDRKPIKDAPLDTLVELYATINGEEINRIGKIHEVDGKRFAVIGGQTHDELVISGWTPVVEEV